MAPTPSQYPPSSTPKPAEHAVSPSIAALQKQIRWLIAGLIGMLMLIIAMAAFTFVAMKKYAAFRTQQIAEERVQLQLLQQIQSDFNAMETQPRNPAEAYGQLREYLGTLQNLYGPMADYDLADPDASLDRIFEQFEESQRNRGRDPEQQRDDEDE